MVALGPRVISHPLLFKVSSSSRTFSQIYFGYRGDFLRCAVHWDMEMSLLMKLETETVNRSQAHTEDPAQAFAEADGVPSDRGAGTVVDTASYEDSGLAPASAAPERSLGAMDVGAEHGLQEPS